MSIDQNPAPQQPYAYAPPAPPAKTGNAVAIVGLIFAFLIPPIGFILSLIGLIRSGRGGRRAVAVIGLVLGLIFSVIGGIAGFEAATKIATVVDPGCTTAKSAILDNQTKVSNNDTIKEGLQATVDGLTSATSKASHDNVRNAVKALNDDYSELLSDVNTGTQPASGLQDKLTNDANAFDALCSVSTS